MWTTTFWRDASERAIKTAAQTLTASFGVGVGVLDVDWGAALSVSAAATVLSILTSIASTGTGNKDTASAESLYTGKQRAL